MFCFQSDQPITSFHQRLAESNQMINNRPMSATETRLARSPGVSYQQLLDADTHPVPDVLRLQSPRSFGDRDIPVERT